MPGCCGGCCCGPLLRWPGGIGEEAAPMGMGMDMDIGIGIMLFMGIIMPGCWC